ncbi:MULTISPECIES: bifunctional 4-hydroxy-2-oxoglutarate aldolase/2-dehydro-3-deoxy-phosphogluconate aldolase [unclassified Leucobacter]|uniref:bifunctional 4-hydroxy-2-oxoglutarate aldolase/2-dehydro-3-deoxy-phosphogluconate aldolase n=1 Tax=unclassified Leucobacter TaxID=2621730 RepID=UPI0019056EDB|nr:bifunctional 4-hydroxy-2-oxoglutarate aldolase/2-dehydro-3-deoxy-phosphogluconate aldolase [Leucobacter sp. L43]
MSPRERAGVPAELRANPVIAVLRAPTAAGYAPVIDALLRGGVRFVEVTLSTPGTIDELPMLVRRFGDDARIGVGTVTETSQAREAIAAGARYLVTPTTDPRIIDVAVDAEVPVYPGGFTPTELHTGWRGGATAVKVFPASKLGPKYVADLRGPFPDIEVIPSGGVDAESALDWLRAGACAVSAGGPLLRDAFDGGDLGELTRRAQALQQSIVDAGLVARVDLGRTGA